MSYNTLSIITTIDDAADYTALSEALQQEFIGSKVRKIAHPFKGIVSQYDLRRDDPEDVEERVIAFSHRFPEKKIALIEVDCFGGKCSSDGSIYQNGETLLGEKPSLIAHVNLLKQLSDQYKTWHFEPFTREYFMKKGGIWGEISNEKLVYFGLSIATDYKQKPGFRCDMTHNELILEKPEKFYIYFMEPFEGCIKILGSVYDDSPETLAELQEIIRAEILYTDAYVFIDLIDSEERIKLTNLGEGMLNETVARARPFNEQVFPFPEKEAPATQQQEQPVKRSFWENVKRFFVREQQ